MHRRKGFVALLVAAPSMAMLGLSFAAVPLYRLFCSATEFGGTPQIAKTAPSEKGQRNRGEHWSLRLSDLSLRARKARERLLEGDNSELTAEVRPHIFSVPPTSRAALRQSPSALFLTANLV